MVVFSTDGWVSISLVPCVHSEVHSECVIVVASDAVSKTTEFSAFSTNSTISINQSINQRISHMHLGIRAKLPYKASKYTTTHTAHHPLMYISLAFNSEGGCPTSQHNHYSSVTFAGHLPTSGLSAFPSQHAQCSQLWLGVKLPIPILLG